MSLGRQPQNPWGVLFFVFFYSLAAVTVSVSLWLLLCINQPFWPFWRADEILKNLMSQSSITWASDVILYTWNEKPGLGRECCSLLAPTSFYDCHSWCRWTRCSEWVDSVVQSLRVCDSYMTKFVFVGRPLMSACLHTLSSAWMCTWGCVFEGQRSQSCSMTTERP